jgi:hypothetical protein
MVLDRRVLRGYDLMGRYSAMSTSTLEQAKTAGAPAPRQSSVRTKSLVLVAFAAVYLVWGSTYLAIRVGIESFPPFVLAGVRHLIAGAVLYAVFRRKTGIRPTGAHWWSRLCLPGSRRC